MPPAHRLAAATAAALTLAGSLTSVTLAAPAAGADPAPASMAPKVLPGDVVHGLASLEASQPHVAADPTALLRLGVSVADPDPAAVRAFDAAVTTPGSPEYHHWLTPAAFDARFGPTPATVAAVSAWLAGGGLTVTGTDPSGVISAVGTVAQVGSLMQTGFEAFPTLGFVANTAAPTVPSAVLGVAGLNTGVRPHLASLHVGPRADTPTMGALSPMDLWDIYKQPATDRGQGQAMALFGYGSLQQSLTAPAGVPIHSVLSDLRDFEKEYSLPQIPFTAHLYATDPHQAVSDVSGYPEWTLDAQAADGMAPDASGLVEYFGATGSDPDILLAYGGWAADPAGPLQGSTSFGQCEEAPGTDPVYTSAASGAVYLGNPAQDQYEQIFSKLVAEGRTLFAASGDTQACPTVSAAANGVTPTGPVPIQDYPGVSPSVVGVGGSVLYFNGRTASAPAGRIVEYPWAYSGGGQSHFETAPAVQASALQPVGPAGTSAGAGLPVDAFTNPTDAHGNAYATPQPARLTPDVAALSGDIAGNGYTICSGGTCDQSAGGTSLSSPLWLGMWTRVQAAAPATGPGVYGGLGFAMSTIYSQAKAATYLSSYYDLGSAGETPPSVPSTSASPNTNPAEGGYDTQTGWGVPNLTAFATAATGNASLTPTNPSASAPGTPAPATPEAPVVVGLPLAGVTAGWWMLRRRRRRVA